MDGTKHAGWPVGLLGMLALIGTAELIVAWQMDRLTSPMVMDWQAARRAAAREANDCAVLYLGSSLSKAGVLPKAIEAGTGLRGYNLALPGGPPASSYFLLRRALAHGARPTCVVVDFHHQRLKDDPCSAASLAPWPQLLGPVEALELGWQQGEVGFAGHLFVASLVPTFRIRYDIRAAIVAALEDRFVSQRGPALVYARNRDRNRGTVVNAKVPGIRGWTAPTEFADDSASWSCHPVNAHFLRRFLDLAASRGIAVYWLMPPLTPNLQTTIDRSRGEEQFLGFVRQHLKRYPLLTIIDARHSGFPHTDFIDPVHLDRTGASSLSRSLAIVLGRNNERWVALPSDDRTADDGRVEDAVQSALALSAGAGVLRR